MKLPPSLPKLGQVETVAALGALAVGAYLVWKAWGTAKGIMTGDNALTQNATDLSGAPVTAYQGAGIVGTAGAAVNAATGGATASLGESLGSWWADVFDPATQAVNASLQPSGASSGSSSPSGSGAGDAAGSGAGSRGSSSAPSAVATAPTMGGAAFDWNAAGSGLSSVFGWASELFQ